MTLIERIARNFSAHEVSMAQQQQIRDLRAASIDLANVIERLVPSSREQSLAMTKLEEVLFWSVAGIARPPE